MPSFQAMIFAAGRGTRLKPLTDTIPKALVKVGNMTMFDHVAAKLLQAGAERLVVNVHHMGGLIVEHIRRHYTGKPVYISFEADELLETGGGLKKAAHLLIPGMPVVVHNVDVISDIDLHLLVQTHLQSKALATLAVRKRLTKRYFLFDSSHRLRGWQNTESGQQIIPGKTPKTLTPLAFSGIQVISPALFAHFPPQQRFPLVDLYLNLCPTHIIRAFDHSADYWTDIGKPEELNEARQRMTQNLR